MSTQFLSPDSFKTFGELLKFLRRREQLTQFELSVSVGYSEAQISRLEQNQRLPDLAALKALFIPALHLEDEPEMSARFLNLAQSARQDDLPAAGTPPYKGLLFFDQSDAGLFFGREALTAQLAQRVMGLTVDASPGFLAVVGASGSGKSSLVRAGLAVALQRAGWETHIFTPTTNPLKMLAANYDTAGFQTSKNHLLLVDQFEETFTLCRDEQERSAFVNRLLAAADEKGANTTVVIALRADFYSHCAQYPHLRRAVAAEQEYIGQMTRDELRRAIEEPAKRSGWEFEPGLADILLNDIGADGTGQPEPGALPLLAHALLATWERRRGRTFTLEGYRASGGVRGAIAETAESVFTDQLNREQQELARNIFLRLTELGEGTEDTRRRATLNELAHTSEDAIPLRTVLNTLAEARLITLSEDSAEVAHEALIREWLRLHDWLTQDREGLRLHRHLTDSALEWERRGRDAAELYRGARLAQISEWASSNEERLNPAERAFVAASSDQEQREALEREAQRQRELKAAQELAETERKRAGEQSAAARRLRRRAFFLAGAAALAALLALAAVLIAITAANNARQATAHQLASAADASLAVDSGQGISLALQSLQIQPAVDTYSLLHRALFSSHLRSSVQAYNGDAIFLAVSPTGDRLATIGGAQNEVKVWQVNGGLINPTPLKTFKGLNSPGGCKGPWSTQLMFSPDGEHLATGGKDGEVNFWSLENGAGGLKATLISQTVQRNEDIVQALRFSPDGHKLADATFEAIHVLDLSPIDSGLPAAELIKIPLKNSKVRLNSIFFTPNGDRLITTELGSLTGYVGITPLGNEIQIWDTATGLLLLNIQPEEQLQAGVISPDGQTFYTAHIGGEIHAWDISNEGSPEGLAAKTGGNGSTLNISPDGKQLLEIDQVDLEGGKYQFSWQRIDGSQLIPEDHFALNLLTRQAAVLANKDLTRIMAIDPHDMLSVFNAASGKMLATIPLGGVGEAPNFVINPEASQLILELDIGSLESVIDVWNIPAKKRLYHFNVQDSGIYVAFSPDGKEIITYSGNSAPNLVRWWDPATGQKIKEIDAQNGVIFGMVFTPDGKYWLSWGEDHTLKIHATATDSLVRTLSPASQINSIIVSPDSRTIAVSFSTSQTALYSLEDGHELVTLPGTSIKFLPDRPVILNINPGDSTVYAFLMDNNDLVRLACERLKNITPMDGVSPSQLKICQENVK